MDFMTQLAGNLRDARVALGMTQVDVATRLSISRSCISQYENGYRMPDLRTTSALAGIYGTTMDDLVPPVVPDDDIDDNQMTFGEDM